MRVRTLSRWGIAYPPIGENVWAERLRDAGQAQALTDRNMYHVIWQLQQTLHRWME